MGVCPPRHTRQDSGRADAARARIERRAFTIMIINYDWRPSRPKHLGIHSCDGGTRAASLFLKRFDPHAGQLAL
eukprot:3799632-Pyramimonas_sp.AAC.1